jgi:hypothetical protein
MMQKMIVAALVAMLPVAAGQDGPKPACSRCTASYISREEMQEYFKRATAAVVDQQVRAVDVGKSHVDIGVVYRGKITGTPAVAEHDQVSEVYYIIEGTATLVPAPTSTGGNRGRRSRRTCAC